MFDSKSTTPQVDAAPVAPPPKYPDVRTLVLDFDSTICAVESMDVLFDRLLENSTEKDYILGEVTRITNLGMTGEISFDESLELRLELLPRLPVPFDAIARRVSERLSPSFLRAAAGWDLRNVHVISSGFRQLIEPVLTPLGFPPDHIHCNVLRLDSRGAILNVDKSIPLAHEGGKPRVLESLVLPRRIVMIGDGYTDWETADFGAADLFFGCAEFVRREKVLSRADEVLTSFDTLSSLIQL